MSFEVEVAKRLCRGKVSSSKQQILKKFSNNYTPVAQYGVDYSKSSKKSTQSTDTQINPNVSVNTDLGCSRVVTSKSIHMSPVSEKSQKVTHRKLNPPSSIYSPPLSTSPQLTRKIILLHNTSSVSESGHLNIVEDLRPRVMSDNTQRARVTQSETGVHQTYKALKSSTDLSSIKDSNQKNIILSPQSEPENGCYFFNNINQSSLLSKANLKKQPVIQENSNNIDENKQNNKQNNNNNNNNSNKNNNNSNLKITRIKMHQHDPTLITVAQRAKSIINKSSSVAQPSSTTAQPAEITNLIEGNNETDEPVMSLKDRIRVYKDSTKPTEVIEKETPTPSKTILKNRYKTQPISIDDIVRANAMYLDQTEVASTIASPTLTNSRETLVDMPEDYGSPLKKDSFLTSPTSPPVSSTTFASGPGSGRRLRKSNSIVKAQHALLSQTSNVNKSFDDEEVVAGISVKEMAKSCFQTEPNHQMPTAAVSGPKNAAISRKMAFKNKTASEDKEAPAYKVYTKRVHLTQPITQSDLDQTEMSSNDNSMTIRDRIAKIKDDGEKWRTRCSRPEELSNVRPKSVYYLQEELKTKQENWKNRIETKDVHQFTAEAKFRNSMRQPSNRYSFHDSVMNDGSSVYIENVQVINRLSSSSNQVIPKFILSSNVVINKSGPGAQNSYGAQFLNQQQNVSTRNVEVPQISDQSLSNFFTEVPNSNSINTNQHSSDDYDDIFINSENLNVIRKSVRPIKNQRAPSRNLLKNLNKRQDIKSEYIERDFRPVKSVLAEEALAGLSSKEDFSKVKLKHGEAMKKFEQFVSPYKEKMLVLIKGRKRVQVRLVKPVVSSLNCGDCYLLILRNVVYVWEGECANVIEVNKANELAGWITKTKCMHYKGIDQKPVVVSSKDNNEKALQFWKCLGYDSIQHCSSMGNLDEDDNYERLIQQTNMVFQVNGNQLIPLDVAWCCPLKYSILQTDKVLLLDFGTEIYQWSGIKANHEDRAYGRDFLKQLFYRGYNYEGCPINPMDPLPDSVEVADKLKGNQRPDWVIVGRLPQNGETTLFKEKFCDWPETSRLIRANRYILSNQTNSLDEKFNPVDLESMLKFECPEMNLIIDGRSVGRGGYWKVREDGIMREFSVITLNLKGWRIVSNKAVPLNASSLGQFCSADAYIIHWEYELKTLGRVHRNNPGIISSAYFFWQGHHTGVTEKAASALITVEMDKEEKCSQVRVIQHEECPAFCRLFDGAMIVHLNSHATINRKNASAPRLFILRGEVEGEAHFVEVDCDSSSLRSRSAFLLISCSSQKQYLWFGRVCSEQMRMCARHSIAALQKCKPVELLQYNIELDIEEVEETNTPRIFWNVMNTRKRWRPSYLFNELLPIRGWHATAVTGEFKLSELRYSLQPNSSPTSPVPAFPLIQSALYSVSQPALFIIWTSKRIFLWQGWYASINSQSSDSSEFNIGMDESEEGDCNLELPKNRVAVEKLATMQTIKNYLNSIGDPSVSASIVYAGLEPLEFQELFPFWELHEEARNMNLNKGYKLNQEDDVEEVLKTYLTATYSLSVLRKLPLPEDVIPWKMESYLSDNEFETLFKMTKTEFYQMPRWKQREKKIEVNLY